MINLFFAVFMLWLSGATTADLVHNWAAMDWTLCLAMIMIAFLMLVQGCVRILEFRDE